MKSKIYLADINGILSESFNNITIKYPEAHKDTTKKGCLRSFITEGTKYIGVGVEGNVNKFSTWKEAADYANTLDYEAYVGVRLSGKSKYDIVGIINKK